MLNRNGKVQLGFSWDEEGISLGKSTIIRPIHYLGSKLRIVQYICNIIDEVDPSRGPVCDLFAGSGTVSGALSHIREVTAVDIQEYSRVLCSALLHPAEVNNASAERFIKKAYLSEESKNLSWAIEPLANYELTCINQAEKSNVEPLCDLLENGSLVAFERNVCSSQEPSLLKALKESCSRLNKSNMVDTPIAITTRYFGGIYFSYVQASHIDILLERTTSLPLAQRDTFLAAILSTTSEVVNTVGKQFAQPIRPRSLNGQPKPHLIDRISRDRSINVIDTYQKWLKRYLAIPKTNRPHRAIRQDYEEALKNLKNVSVIYADPPYTRDHYSRYYHVLETLCLRDNPKISTVRIHGQNRMSRGIYRVDRHQSPFCIHTEAPKAFSTLFAGVRALDIPLVLSYSPYKNITNSRPRLMTIKQIEELAKTYFKHIEISRPGHITHSKLTNSEKTFGISHDAEVLFICEP